MATTVTTGRREIADQIIENFRQMVYREIESGRDVTFFHERDIESDDIGGPMAVARCKGEAVGFRTGSLMRDINRGR